jgi:hypothetical protein
MGIAYERTENMLVLPVLTTKQIPNFVAAFYCFWLGTGKRSIAVKKLADKEGAVPQRWADKCQLSYQLRRTIPPRDR